ncbi:MAG: hypothetical protein AAF916_08680 [Planctomycetota bacterium]
MKREALIVVLIACSVLVSGCYFFVPRQYNTEIRVIVLRPGEVFETGGNGSYRYVGLEDQSHGIYAVLEPIDAEHPLALTTGVSAGVYLDHESLDVLEMNTETGVIRLELQYPVAVPTWQF